MKTAIIISMVGIVSSLSALEVSLTVEEPAGAERKLEVVSGGIPPFLQGNIRIVEHSVYTMEIQKFPFKFRRL